MLFSHLRLYLASDLFPSGFHTKALYAHLLSPKRATFPAHLVLLDLITRILFGEEFVCLFWRNNPPVGQGLLIREVSRSH